MTTTYAFNNLYEIHRSPGEPEKHTLYIPGIEGDMVAQYTRSDAMLVQTNIDEDRYASVFVDSPEQNTFLDQRRNFQEAKTFIVSLYREIETDIALVWFNIPKPKLLTDNYQMLPSMRVIIWLLAFGILIYYALTLKSLESVATRRVRLATAFALFPFYFALSAGCSPLFFGGAQGEEGIPPWLLGALVPGDTPSVSDDPTFFGGGNTPSTTNSARITGMYFFHPDHLGSITMITDGRGNVLAGGERGGKSHISYRPYGEILRTDSYGPDISKFKYTGQEEDRESGLYFYKSRYYDSKIGRFIQSDSLSFYMSEQGMNPYSYVEGNPISYNDPTGFAKCPSKSNWLVAGAWSGAGLCGDFKPDKAFIKDFVLLSIILHISGETITPEQKSLVILNYYLENRPQNALTPIDEASRDHDSDDPGFFKGTKENTRADANWIKNAWSYSPFYNTGYFPTTFKREFDAVGNKCKLGKSGINARDLCAGINTIGTYGADLTVLWLGTGLFLTDIAISSIVKGINDVSNIKKERYYIRSERFNVKNINLPKISIKGITNNLFKPGKWKL